MIWQIIRELVSNLAEYGHLVVLVYVVAFGVIVIFGHLDSDA